MKKKLLISLLCLAIVLPVCMAEEQDTESEGAASTEQPAQTQSKAEDSASAKQPAPAKSKAEGSANAGQASQIKKTAEGWIAKIVAIISQIGALFGSKSGFRIGGTTGTAIATLAVAKLVENKAPSWVKWLLYLTGGTMFAGSGANIAQMVMKDIGL